MKNLRIAALALPFIFGCSVTSAASAAHHTAHQMQMNEVSFQQALDMIEKAGYKNLHKIELEHNRYEVEAFDANGKEVAFDIDAKTGAMTAAKHEKHHKKHHGKHHAKHHAKHAAEKAATDKTAPAQ